MRFCSFAAVFCLCATALSQSAPKAGAVLRENLVTKAVMIRGEGAAILRGSKGRILRRLLTPSVGTIEHFPKTNILVVKDTDLVVDSIVVLVRHFDGGSPLRVTTRSFPVRYCGYRVAARDGEIMAAFRRMSSPAVGRVAYDRANRMLVATDTTAVLSEIARILKVIDVEPRQVFVDVQFVTTGNAKLWRDAIAPVAAASQAGLGVLTAASATAVMRVAKQDIQTKIVQAPKLIALDHHEASVFIGSRKPSAPANAVGYEASLIPHVVPGTDKLILDVRRGRNVDQVLIKAGQTVVYCYFDAAEREVVVFLTPREIRTPKPARGKDTAATPRKSDRR